MINILEYIIHYNEIIKRHHTTKKDEVNYEGN